MEQNYQTKASGEKMTLVFSSVLALVFFVAMCYQGAVWSELADKAFRSSFEDMLLVWYACIFSGYAGLVIWTLSIMPDCMVKKFFLRIWDGLLR